MGDHLLIPWHPCRGEKGPAMQSPSGLMPVWNQGQQNEGFFRPQICLLPSALTPDKYPRAFYRCSSMSVAFWLTDVYFVILCLFGLKYRLCLKQATLFFKVTIISSKQNLGQFLPWTSNASFVFTRLWPVERDIVTCLRKFVRESITWRTLVAGQMKSMLICYFLEYWLHNGTCKILKSLLVQLNIWKPLLQDWMGQSPVECSQPPPNNVGTFWVSPVQPTPQHSW